jgi:hypothetical protein
MHHAGSTRYRYPTHLTSNPPRRLYIELSCALPRAEPGNHITARQPEASLASLVLGPERKKHQGAVSEIKVEIKERQICRCGECATIPNPSTVPRRNMFRIASLGLVVLTCLPSVFCFFSPSPPATVVDEPMRDDGRMNGSLSVRLVHSPFSAIIIF